jgi:hypothetical protein
MLIDIAENHEIPSFVLESNLEKLVMTKLSGWQSVSILEKIQELRNATRD